MKKYYLFIALAMVAAMTVSCKNNNKKAKEAAEATEEVVEAAKTILADDVLATLDEIAKPFIDDAGKVEAYRIIADNLTPEEKMVKPDYLMDPSEVDNMITKSQKVNALAVLVIERFIRQAYDMPVEESEAAIARLVADIDIPNVNNGENQDLSIAKKAAENYRLFKERGDLPLFWQFQFALINESAFLISQNPDPFFRNLTEEQYATFNGRIISCYAAVEELAKYDEEVAASLKVFQDNMTVSTQEEAEKVYSSLATAKQAIINSKDVIAARRAALLK